MQGIDWLCTTAVPNTWDFTKKSYDKISSTYVSRNADINLGYSAIQATLAGVQQVSPEAAWTVMKIQRLMAILDLGEVGYLSARLYTAIQKKYYPNVSSDGTTAAPQITSGSSQRWNFTRELGPRFFAGAVAAITVSVAVVVFSHYCLLKPSLDPSTVLKMIAPNAKNISVYWAFSCAEKTLSSLCVLRAVLSIALGYVEGKDSTKRYATGALQLATAFGINSLPILRMTEDRVGDFPVIRLTENPEGKTEFIKEISTHFDFYVPRKTIANPEGMQQLMKRIYKFNAQIMDSTGFVCEKVAIRSRGWKTGSYYYNYTAVSLSSPPPNLTTWGASIFKDSLEDDTWTGLGKWDRYFSWYLQPENESRYYAFHAPFRVISEVGDHIGKLYRSLASYF